MECVHFLIFQTVRNRARIPREIVLRNDLLFWSEFYNFEFRNITAIQSRRRNFTFRTQSTVWIKIEIIFGSSKFWFSEIDFAREHSAGPFFQVLSLKASATIELEKHNYFRKLSLNFTQLADQKKEIITLTWIFSPR